MILTELLALLRTQNIHLFVEEGKLKYEAPRNALTDEIKHIIKAHKNALIESLSNTASLNRSAILPAPRTEALLLSYAQQRLWFLDQLEPCNAFYNIPMALRITGQINTLALEQSINEIVRRHENLRTRFVTANGQGEQVIIDSLRIPVPCVDLSDLPEPIRQSLALKLCQQEATAPFDLATGPLIRSHFICLSNESDQQEAILLVTLHHIVSDGWSNGVLTREFVTLYQTFSKGLASPLNELAIQYADFAYWQRQWLDGAVLQRQIDYWQQKLSGAPALLELPTDHPRPSVTRYHGSSYPFTVPLALSEQIQALSRQHQVTLFVTMLTSFSALLSRYSQQTNLCIGTPIANRNRLEIEELIGFFVNTLVLRTDLSGEPSFVQLLAQLNNTVQEAQNHQDLPFEQLVTLLQPERSLSHSPLFQVLFTLDNATTQSAATLPGLTIGGIEGEGTIAKFDLSLHISQTTNGLLQCAFEYNTDLFEASTMARMAQHYLNLLQGIVEHPQQSVARLPLLTAAETRQLLVDFNATETEFPQHLCIQQLFEQQVEQTPDAIALVYEDQSLSYDQLNRKANRLAHHLIALGIRPDDRVAICVERSLEMVIGLLGILKAGGAYVPLDPSYPQERLAYMLADCAPVALLTQQALQAESALFDASFQAPVILLDALDDQADAADLKHNPDPMAMGLTSQHLAYIIYTSGSTGQPKGVMVSHANVGRLFAVTDAQFNFNNDDVWTLFHSFAFDFSVWELWGALLYGGRLVIVSYATSRNPDDFYRLLCQERVTVLNQTPSAFKQLIAAQAQNPLDHSLRYIVFGGEALEFHSLIPWLERNDPEHTQLINMYGITEITVHATYRRLTQQDIEASQASNVGTGLADLQIYLLDQHLHPVPLGVTGELYIGGAGVARGYLGRPELTAERFIDNPFKQNIHGQAPARLYKTGDLGRWLPDGSIEYLGRNDFQVKIRGFRIELGEIEAQLSRCPDVREAVVIAREDVPGDKHLVAYLLADAGQALSAADLRSQLSATLADYMLPSAFVTLDVFPLTPNGKLDRKALPAPDGSAVITRPYEAPQGETETVIADIWKELLHLDEVGRHDQFFELGGHSLLVVTLIERMRQHGLTATVRTVFTAPILENMAALVDNKDSTHTLITVPPNLIPEDCLAITPELLPLISLTQTEIDGLIKAAPGGVGNIQDIYPLAPLQEGILFHHLLETQGDAYLLRTVLSFDNRSCLDGFLSALQSVIDRHDILRTAIHWQGLPQPVQVVQRQASLPIIKLELTGNTSDTVYDQLLKQTDPRQLRLNLQQAPLFAAYIAFDPLTNEWLLSLLTHHLVCEHVTLELIIAEIQQILAGQLASSLPAPLPYRNFIAQALSVSPAEHEAYFCERLGDIDAPTAPCDILDVQGDGSRIREATVPLSADLAQHIRSSAKQHGVTTAVLFHLAWAQVLAQCTGRDDVVFGTVLMGRLQGSNDADRVLGLFINTLPIRISLGAHSVRQLVNETYRNLSDLLNHEQASLALAQRCSAVEAPMPLFTTLLNYRHSGTQANPTPDNDAALVNQSAWEGIKVHHGEERTNYPITLSVDDFGRDFSLTAQCVNGINPERMAAYLETAVSQLVDALNQQPELPINRLSILPPSEWQQVINDFNATEADFPQHLCIHQLFEQQVEQTPDAIALVYEDQSLSYDQLNRRANRLAHQLIGLGIRPDDRVAICVERSLEMVIGLLGILKAGGAYVPLDPGYPEERLAYMLADCAPVALLTQQALLAESALFDERLQVPLILLDALDDLTHANALEYNPDPVALGLTSQHLAYVIYTSGSTGQPKGVMNQHQGLVNRLWWAQNEYRLDNSDRILQKTPFSFDVSVWEFFLPLLAGAQLVIAKAKGHQDPHYLAELMAEARITTVHFVPSMLQVFLDQADVLPCTSLRRVLCSGEALPYTLQMRFHALLPNVELHNLYGPTEAAIDVTSWLCRPEHLLDIVPIGHPIANTQMYILDAHLQPVPLGVTGELYIGGAGVARGYLGRPELTAERFIDNPFKQHVHGHASARLYKTGDLGRWLPDGSIEYLGRNDFQVKIRGFRIELGEIEAQLSRCDGVREAVVIAREDLPGNKRLVAYLLADAGQSPSAADLRSQLAASLADYMLPSAFVTLDAFPLTPNGKLDRKALPAPDGSAVITRPYEAPQGETETVIAEIWKELLHLDRIGRYDQFFELGGHSLLVVTLIDRMRQQGLIATVRTVFTAPILADMAALLNGQNSPVPTVMVPPNLISEDCVAIKPELLPLIVLTQAEIDGLIDIVPGGVSNIQDIYPLAPLQEGILFHHLLESQGDAYLLRSVLSFDNRTRLNGFLTALQTVIDRHDILRTAIHWQGLPQPAQVVQRQASLPIVELELIADSQETVYDRLLKQTDPRRLRLNLQQAPLFAAYIAFDPQADEWLLSLLTHHLVCEHVTLEFIIVEIQQILAGQLASLPAPLPYRNFIAQALSVSPAEHEAYFSERLNDIDAPTAPFDIFDVQGDGSRIREAAVPLSADLAQRIRSSAKQHGVTTAVLFHLAWAQVLAQCTGRDDVVFGTVLMGRLQGSDDADRVLGLFINTLPIRISLGEYGVRQLVDETYRNLSELLNHEQASLALAQRCSEVEAPMPLFTTLFNYRHSGTQGNPTTDNDATLAEQLAWEGIKVHHGEERTNYPITVSVDDFGLDFSLTAQCVNGINAERMAAYLETAVSQLVDALGQQPELPINRLSILPPYEWQQIINDFNATEADFPQHLCIHQLFEQQVKQSPDAIALVYEDQNLSYDQLNRRANRLAHHLITLGIRPDDRVVICVERSLEMVIGLLGILKAGGAYVPLDPSYPEERLAYMLADCAPVALLTQQALQAESTLFDVSFQVPVILLDAFDDWTQTQEQAQHDTLKQVLVAPNGLEHNTDLATLGLTSQHLAYVIYTSGSTGQPKGTLINHVNVVRLFTGSQEQFQFTSNDIWTFFHSYAFDFSVWELWGALLYGGRLVVVPYNTSRNPDAFYRLVAQQRVTILSQTPSAFRQLTSAQAQNPLSNNLRYIILGGEALEANLLTAWHNHNDLKCPSLRFINGYGPTETTIFATTYCCRLDHTGIVPIGYPLANTQVYILDAHLQPVPLGVTGELYIGGAGVARGYLNRPELTAERFIDNPFKQNVHGQASPRLYKTGDLGRWLPDGSIEYLGRNDFQVKIRGFRIELGEIEAQLSLCAGVREAVVIAREDVPGDKRLVAYLLADADQELSAADLRSQLSASLADYMLPSAFVTLEAFPLTPNGKLDRKALPAPDGSAVITRLYEAPQGETEILIADIWKELLHLDRVGRYDQFFELGGHSLLAVQLVARVRQTLGVELALRELFAYPVLADLVQAINKAQRSELPAVVPADRSQPLPLSWAQQRLWFLAQLDAAASQAYHIPAGLRLHGQLDKLALIDSLNRIVARHEVLRTTFVSVDGEPRQIIASSDSGFTLLEHDLRGLTFEAQAQTLAQICQDEVNQPFDLATGPLIRGRLLQLTDDEHVLLITQHHIISDGWSIGRLVDEFSTLYTAFSQGQADPLPPLILQYADYAVWQRQWLQGEVLQAQIDFWKDQLAGAPELLELPTDFQRPAQQSYAGAGVDFTLSSELTTQLKHFSQRHNVTLFMTLLTAWSVLMARLSGQNDVVIGTPIANRAHADLENLIGFFVNTLALRVRLNDEPSTEQLLEQVKAMTLAAYAHQDLPFEQLVEAVKPTRSMSHSPLFQAMLALNNTPTGGELSLPRLELSAQGLEQSTTQFDLSLSVTDLGDVIAGNLHYASDLFTTETITRLVGYFQTLLTGMLEDDQQAVSHLPLLSTAETRQLLVDFNATETEFPQHLCIQQLFEQQVEQTPDAIALVYEDQSLSYDQLNRKANRLAHHLIALGIRPDDRVAICVERSLEMVIGLLGILKAGGAYVPLDPSYPQERLAYMLADCAPVALLTQQALQAESALFDASFQAPVILLDALDDQADAADLKHNPDPMAMGLTSQHLAYIIYTSGSTGQPKGVMVSHANVGRLFAVTDAQFNFNNDDVWTLFHSFAFDFSVWELWGALLYGGRLVIVSYATSRNPDDFYRLLCQERVTVLNQTPSAFKQLIAAQAQNPLDHSLRYIVFGGEALEFHSLIPWLERNDPEHTQLINMYGITEITVHATYRRLTQQDIEASQASNVGTGLADLQIYLLDQHLHPVPLGVTGELYIGGAGVARGYLGRPELTAERFIDNPFKQNLHGQASARLYKTGDLGRWLPDGSIEYLGRNDFQVKIRGFRIELGEIEAQLERCAGVREAVVIAREDSPGDKRLVAYVVAEEGYTVSATDLRGQLAAVLTDYMLPSAFVSLESLPLTANGKLDRRALSAPDGSAVFSRAFAAPEGVLETTLAEIWQDLLHLERVGRDDNFFELGGHSLLAVQLVARLRQKLDIEIALRQLFAEPTLNRFAETISSQCSDKPYSNLVSIRATGNLNPLFLIHPGKGEIGYARTLAPWLDADIPVYGLAATGFLLGETPLSTIEEMAGLYIKAIRHVQPKGPYRLAGWSAGGTIAYEIANQLIGADECVEFVGLIDSTYQYSELIPVKDDIDVLLIIMSDLVPPDCYAELKNMAIAGNIDAMLEYCRESNLLPKDLSEIDNLTAKRMLDVFKAFHQAIVSYSLPAISAPLTLFAAKEKDGFEDFCACWKAIAGDYLQIVPIEGNHLSIMELPYIEQLGVALSGALKTAGSAAGHPEHGYSPLITIQSGQSAVKPLFCVPGAGASITAFYELTKTLEPNLPIYGLQPRGLEGVFVPHVDVPSAASAYIKAIREVSPNGPYRLLGHSFGGWVIFEMALQLTKIGEKIETLIALDTEAPAILGEQKKRYSHIEMLLELVKLFELSINTTLGLTTAEFLGLNKDEQLSLLLSRLIEVKLMPPRTNIQTLQCIVRVFEANLNTNYVPDYVYPEPLYLVKVADITDDHIDVQNSMTDFFGLWQQHAPKATLWEGTGNHITLLSTPYVTKLAEWLKLLL